MDSGFESGFALWLWPLTTAKLAVQWTETMSDSLEIVGSRLPVIAHAAARPFSADHRELNRMITEKAVAFQRSGQSITDILSLIGRNAQSNARFFGRMAGGDAPSFSEWNRFAARNLQAAAALAALPSAALAPVHQTVKTNRRRLRSAVPR